MLGGVGFSTPDTTVRFNPETKERSLDALRWACSRTGPRIWRTARGWSTRAPSSCAGHRTRTIASA